MNTQPEALRLAEWLEDQYDPTHNQEKAAAELRRLHAENEALRKELRMEQTISFRVQMQGYAAQRDALLEALKRVVGFWDRLNFDGSAINNLHADARAAIAKATGSQS